MVTRQKNDGLSIYIYYYNVYVKKMNWWAGMLDAKGAMRIHHYTVKKENIEIAKTCCGRDLYTLILSTVYL